MADKMDVIYQIREMIRRSKFTFDIQYGKTIKNDDFNLASNDEKLVQLMHLKSYSYFTKPKAILPRQFSDFFPGTGIGIVANNKSVVTNIGMTIHALERKLMIDEYFLKRFDVVNKLIDRIDSYTLGRVIMKNKKRHGTYSKIINRKLNTMVVNNRWKGGSDRCPVCLKEREEWYHHLVCQSTYMIRVREKLLTDMPMDFEHFKTNPALADYIIDYLQTLHLGRIPERPSKM